MLLLPISSLPFGESANDSEPDVSREARNDGEASRSDGGPLGLDGPFQRPPDPLVERVLTAMRAEPGRPWKITDLARRAGLSRAAFARRFKDATGVAPLRWLAEHRLALAAETLRTSALPLAGVAHLVGYRCEYAFSKAFKRVYGIPPSVFRRAATTPRFKAAA